MNLHRSCLALIVLLTASCRGGVVVEGTVEDADERPAVVSVSLEDGEAVELTDRAFRMRLPSGVPLPLLLHGEDGVLARLEIGVLPRGSRVRLHELWLDVSEELAFPQRVELSGAPVVSVNHIRFADRVHAGELEMEGLILARSSGRLILRPHDVRLGDLFVMVDDDTEVVDRDGANTRLLRAERDDSALVSGRMGEGGLVLASRVVIPVREEPPPPPPPTRRPRLLGVPVIPGQPRPSATPGPPAESAAPGRGDQGRGNEGRGNPGRGRGRD
jgi:hypothetical protein